MKNLLQLMVLLGASLFIMSCNKSSENVLPAETDTARSPGGPTTPTDPATSAGYTYTYDSSFKATGTFITMGAVQPDGKVIVGNPTQIGRLNKDGTRDMGFVTGTAGSGEFHTVALQKDGKILVGGNFTKYNDQNKAYYVRLNADGSIDKSFTIKDLVIQSNTKTDIKSFALQADGNILMGGSFFYPLSYDASGLYTGVQNLIRLNADGSYDATFKQTLLKQSMINCVTLLKDGKMLVTGQSVGMSYFPSPTTSKQYNHILRLNSDGSLDPSFEYKGKFEMLDPYRYLPTFGQTIAVQDDGKILLGGRFETTSTDINQDYRSVVRLNTDGAIDPTYPRRAYISIATSIYLSSDRSIVGLIHDPEKQYMDASAIFHLYNKDGSDNGKLSFKGFPGYGETYAILEDENKNLLVLGKIYDKMGVAVYTFHGIIRLKRS